MTYERVTHADGGSWCVERWDDYTQRWARVQGVDSYQDGLQLITEREQWRRMLEGRR